MNMKIILLAFSALLACSETLPPQELVSARAEYARVSAGDAQRLQPAKVYEAKQALDQAESKFKSDGDGPATKDLAYVAQRKAQYADVVSNLTVAEQTYAQADKDMRALTGRALERAQQKLAEQQQDLEKERQNVEHARADADREHAARLEAERRMKQAIEDLAKIAAIKEEQRGMVITLTGNVLFVTGKWDLLPTAQVKLNEVAEALKTQTDRDIVIEGHTDNVGTPASNVELAQKRAESVRDYFASRGVDKARIKALGVGQARPIADNSTPEGRANNRRVEIIVSPPKEPR